MARPSCNTKDLFDQARDSLRLLQTKIQELPETNQSAPVEIPYAGTPSPGMKTAIASVLTYAFKGVAYVEHDRDPAFHQVWINQKNRAETLDTSALARKIDYLQESLKICWQKATDSKGGPAWKRTFLRETPEEDICKKAMGGILAGLSLDWSDRAAAGEGAGIYAVADWSDKEKDPYALISGPQELQREILKQFSATPKI